MLRFPRIMSNTLLDIISTLSSYVMTHHIRDYVFRLYSRMCASFVNVATAKSVARANANNEDPLKTLYVILQPVSDKSYMQELMRQIDCRPDASPGRGKNITISRSTSPRIISRSKVVYRSHMPYRLHIYHFLRRLRLLIGCR